MATQTAFPNGTHAPTSADFHRSASRYAQLRHVLELIPVGRTTLYELMKVEVDPFPGAISLGPLRPNGRARIAVWDLEEVYAWLDRQAQKPRTVGTHPREATQQPA